MRTLSILLLFWLIVKPSVGQNLPVFNKNHPLYQLESRLMKGDKTALFEIAPYFNSSKKVIEFLGYHRLETVESEIARRIVTENSLFTIDEFSITDSATTKQFTDFLHQNTNKVNFSKLATSFLITPLNQRAVTFEVRAVSETRMRELRDMTHALLSPDWVKESKIDSLAKQGNSISLLTIASELFKIRSKFNSHYFYEEEFTNLLQYLTGIEIGVENKNKEISWHIDKNYDPESKLNLLIYFSKYYSQYSWDEKRSAFLNPNHEIKPIEKERLLFQLLNNKNDSVAIDAFTRLTISNPTKVTQLANEYKSADIETSYAIPIFPYKFLKQLVLLTDYYRANSIDFVGTKDLQNSIALLQSKLPFRERRKLEDKLIESLTLDDITAFEYWSLIYEQSWGLTYSAGRILDVFYSRNWNKLITNGKYLECYFKKSALFDRLGIIGICNNYLKKFPPLSQSNLTMLETFQTTDSDVRMQLEKVILFNVNPNKKKRKGSKSGIGNQNHHVKDLEKELFKKMKNITDSSETEDAISTILSQIDYSQIPIAIKAIEDYPFQTERKKYSFLQEDWGFFMAGNFGKKEIRDEFLKLYSRFSEYQLYAYYLAEAGIDYLTVDNKLDYDKIYELLKYDVVVAFVGGGGATQDNEVYALVKLLELTFKTTLDYPNKLCNSDNMYACDSDDRAQEWMTYLIEKKLLNQKHNEPGSFHHE